MIENETLGTEEPRENFPRNWQVAADYDPNNHLMNLKGRDYLNVQNRLLWFIRDQRAFIAAGLARMPYVIRTELVEMDREISWAHFKTYVRDVLGNESTMYGSEAAKDFPDYAEKASTKSLGRALLALGYGTAFAPEMDEGERVVDSPVERQRAAPVRATPSGPRPTPPSSRPTPRSAQVIAEGLMPLSTTPASKIPGSAPAGMEAPKPTPATVGEQPATEQQLISIRKLCAALSRPEPTEPLTYASARGLITQLSGEYQRARRAS